MLNKKYTLVFILITLTSLGCQPKAHETIYLSCNGVFENNIAYTKPRDEKLTLTAEYRTYPNSEKNVWWVDSGNHNLMMGFFPADMRDEKTKEGEVIRTFVTDTEIKGTAISKYNDGTRNFREVTVDRINGAINYEQEFYYPKNNETYRHVYKGTCEPGKKI